MRRLDVAGRAVEFARVAGVQRMVERLSPYVGRTWFAALAAPLAFGATASLSIPVVPLLVSLVALRRDRWLALALWAALGSTLAGTLFTYLAATYGMALVDARLPQLAQSRHWHYLVEWVGRYGVFTLMAVAASPFAQTPVLLLAAMLGMPWPAVALALAIGKSVKYGAMAALTARASESLVSLSGNEHAPSLAPRQAEPARSSMQPPA